MKRFKVTVTVTAVEDHIYFVDAEDENAAGEQVMSGDEDPSLIHSIDIDAEVSEVMEVLDG